MPELPEVEVIVRELRKRILNKRIIDVEIREPSLIGFPENRDKFVEELLNKKIITLSRSGKYILIDLDNQKRLVIHLRMSGKLLIKDNLEDYDKHTHIIFKLDGGIDLHFNSIRKFSRAYLIDSNYPQNAGGLAELGPEPLSSDFTVENFKSLLKNRKAKIKSLLLNQKFLAGMGNIYTDEALFRAEIRPDRRADTLSEREIENLYRAIRIVLSAGIKYGGTTFSDYVNTMGQKGNFQQELMVYQRKDEKCYKCGSKINREKICGRSSYYCPTCQQ